MRDRKITGEEPVSMPTSAMRRFKEAVQDRRVISRDVCEASPWERVLGIKFSISEKWESLPDPHEW